MKLLICVWTLYLLVSFEAFAQTRVRIVDQSINDILPYATVVNITNPAIQFADQYGVVILDWPVSDFIRLTHVGYDDVVIQISKISNATIGMVPKTTILPTVAVRSCLNPSVHGYTNSVSTNEKFGGMSWQADIEGAKAAVMVYPTDPDSQLSSFEFELKKSFPAPKGFPASPIRFTFYSIDPDTKLPSEPLIVQSVIYYPKKTGKQTVNIDSLRLAVPDSGLYIAIEYLVEKKYCHPMERRDSLKNVIEVDWQYGLMFDGVRAKEFPLAFYSYQEGNWQWPQRRKEKDLEKVRGTIKFGVVYKSCK